MLVTIAILARNKGHCLPFFLKCIVNQTYPKDQILIYIRTNDNHDQTESILQEWVNQYGHLYREVLFDSSSLDPTNYLPHQWTKERFATLGQIRQESILFARKRGTSYFVVDCDNFIHHQTLEKLIRTGLPVVGPFLITDRTLYSNYHHRVNAKGYFINNPEYHLIYHQTITGLIEVDVIHCTYFIRSEVLPQVSYLPDGSNRHEYVIFSDLLRNKNIKQYLDNRAIYGYITFSNSQEELEQEDWYKNEKSLKPEFPALNV